MFIKILPHRIIDFLNVEGISFMIEKNSLISAKIGFIILIRSNF